MKIYFVDLGWKGAIFAIANSIEFAFKFQNHFNNFEKFKDRVEVFDFEEGLSLYSMGDQ